MALSFFLKVHAPDLRIMGRFFLSTRNLLRVLDVLRAGTAIEKHLLQNFKNIQQKEFYLLFITFATNL